MQKENFEDSSQNNFNWNPADSSNTIGKFTKTAFAFGEIGSLTSGLFTELIFVMAGIYFSISTQSNSWFIIIILVSAVLSLASNLFAFLKIRSIKDVDSVSGFIEVFKTAQLCKAFQSITSGVSFLLVGYLFFKRFFIDLFSYSIYGKTTIILAAACVLLFFLAGGIIELFRLWGYTKAKEKVSSKTEAMQYIAVTNEKVDMFSFAQFIPFFGLFYLMLKPLIPIISQTPDSASLYFVAGVILVGGFVVMPVLNFIRLKRIKSINLSTFSDPTPVNSSQPINIAAVDPSEKTLLSLYGIWNADSYGVEILGKGERKMPENTMVITNKRFIFLKIPVFGAGVLMDGVDYSTENNLWNRAEIKAKAEEMLAKESLNKIIASDKDNYEIVISDIKLIKLVKKGWINVPRLEIHLNNGKMHKYLWVDKEYPKLLEENLPNILNERFGIV
jgi:hypothetical protein